MRALVAGRADEDAVSLVPGGGELRCYLLGGIGLGAELVFRGGALLGGNRARFGGHVALVGAARAMGGGKT